MTGRPPSSSSARAQPNETHRLFCCGEIGILPAETPRDLGERTLDEFTVSLDRGRKPGREE